MYILNYVRLNTKTSSLNTGNYVAIRMYNPCWQGFLSVFFTLVSPKPVMLLLFYTCVWDAWISSFHLFPLKFYHSVHKIDLELAHVYPRFFILPHYHHLLCKIVGQPVPLYSILTITNLLFLKMDQIMLIPSLNRFSLLLRSSLKSLPWPTVCSSFPLCSSAHPHFTHLSLSRVP